MPALPASQTPAFWERDPDVAPIYVSNNCVNSCCYCGFARWNNGARVKLSAEDVRREDDAVVAQGFRSLFSVASENPWLVTPEYLAEFPRIQKPSRRRVAQVSVTEFDMRRVGHT